jgi:hypothetical protein
MTQEMVINDERDTGNVEITIQNVDLTTEKELEISLGIEKLS